MNALYKIVTATFAPVMTAGDDTSNSPFAPTERMKVVSRQLLTFRLTITYDNVAKDVSKEQAVTAFLSMIGVHSLEAAWAYLFGAVQVVPFLICRSDLSPVFEGEALSSPLQADSVPLQPTASEGWSTSTGSTFVCGTPRFWSSHCYTRSSSDATPRRGHSAALHGATTKGPPTANNFPSLVAVHSLPTVTATASPSFTNNNSDISHSHRRSASDSDVYWGSSTGVRCEVIGSVSTVVADEGSPRRLPAEESTPGESAAVGITRADLPLLLESQYTVELMLPDFEAASLRGLDTALAIVVLLPSCAADDGSATTAVAGSGDQPSILRSVLARSVGQTQVEMASASALVFGSGLVPVQLTEPFLCVSSTSPLSNDRLVLNLSLTNVTCSAARLYSASFDLNSSCMLPDAAITGGGLDGAKPGEPRITSSSLWGEMRPGANLSSMRTIDLLTKLVTITPVVVGEERPPVVLYPGETYSFQFVIEVLPQLCYLLNLQSLEYLYERYYAVSHSAVGGRCSDDSSISNRGESGSRGGGRSSAAATFAHGSTVTDCYGKTVTAAELRSILSYSYLSHLFVYYDLAPGHTVSDGRSVRQPTLGSGLACRSGLCLRYQAQWSFGA
ncbi:hypothetical protein JKF63_04826 [Porcisia hertigi]|uniref:Uncharacterized protein n=1 Tax=Porcisia hertigi TaxID=2761500 RepID=A0A836IHE6_9TRYP|nr:hypothetical protein JKF63_04826 [Porcisia hertigi]